jgi:hypothetical protein
MAKNDGLKPDWVAALERLNEAGEQGIGGHLGDKLPDRRFLTALERRGHAKEVRPGVWIATAKGREQSRPAGPPPQTPPAGWTRAHPDVGVTGDCGGDVQASEAYNMRWTQPLPDGNTAVITRSFYAAVEYDDEDRTGPRHLTQQTEYLVCTDPTDPGGTEVWSDYRDERLGPLPQSERICDREARAAAAAARPPSNIEWNKTLAMQSRVAVTFDGAPVSRFTLEPEPTLEVEAQIRAAYTRLAQDPAARRLGNIVPLAEVRAALPADIPNDTVEAALHRLAGHPDVHIAPSGMYRTDEDRAAALWMGNQHNHTLTIDPERPTHLVADGLHSRDRGDATSIVAALTDQEVTAVARQLGVETAGDPDATRQRLIDQAAANRDAWLADGRQGEADGKLLYRADNDPDWVAGWTDEDRAAVAAAAGRLQQRLNDGDEQWEYARERIGRWTPKEIDQVEDATEQDATELAITELAITEAEHTRPAEDRLLRQAAGPGASGSDVDDAEGLRDHRARQAAAAADAATAREAATDDGVLGPELFDRPRYESVCEGCGAVNAGMHDHDGVPVDRYGDTGEQSAERLFEAENCHECGRGAEDHDAVELLGNWFHPCRHPALDDDAQPSGNQSVPHRGGVSSPDELHAQLRTLADEVTGELEDSECGLARADAEAARSTAMATSAKRLVMPARDVAMVQGLAAPALARFAAARDRVTADVDFLARIGEAVTMAAGHVQLVGQAAGDWYQGSTATPTMT